MKIIVAWFIVIVAIEVVSHYGDQAHQTDRNQYCNMVSARAWPDFDRNYKKICQTGRKTTPEKQK